MMKQYIVALLAFSGMTSLCAQPADAVLFSVKGGDDVKVSEFKFVYEKNNGSQATYQRPSVEEYLRLYENYKLKVRKAREMGLDKDEKLRSELESYRRQLSASYLTDREIVEKLVKEAYQRSRKDVHISHILFSHKANDDAAAAKALADANEVKSRLNTSNFAELAKKHSADPSASTNGGDVGFFTVFQLPYDLESAVWNANEGDIVGPVHTSYGYHLVWVQGSRPALGQVQAAQILCRTKAGDNEKNLKAEETIRKAYKELQAGATWAELVTQYSEDNSTKGKEGALGWFGINKYDSNFEKIAFGLKSDGDYSEPFQSSAGWHILRRVKRLQAPSYEESKAELSQKVKKDARFEQVQTALVERIKRESGYTVFEDVKSELGKLLNASYTTYQWKTPAEAPLDKVLFKVGDRSVTVKEYCEFAEKNPVSRVSNPQAGANPAPTDPVQDAFKRNLAAHSQKVAMEYEEKQLEGKYPEYRMLMREYDEGILLFEATKKLVWDKAASDEAGLTAFYDKNKDKYKWGQRLKVTTFTIQSTDDNVIAPIKKAAKKKAAADVSKKFNEKETLVATNDLTFEVGKAPNAELAKLAAKKGSLSEPVKKDGKTIFYKVNEVVSPAVKTLQESRGYVVADYQDALEKQWIEELHKEFPVSLHKDVLESLIKK